MWLQKNNNQVELKKTSINSLTAVAIDKDKNSQNALKWAIDNLLHRGQPVALIHVKLKSPSHSSSTPLPNNPSKYLSMTEEASLVCKDPDPQTKELFLPFRCFSTRRDIHCKDVVLEDTDVAKALIEYAAQTAIENLVLGASSKGGFLRFKATDVPSTVSKGAPNFCNVYVINKGKIQSTRSALRPAPAVSSLYNELYNECKAQKKRPHIQPAHTIKGKECRTQEKPPQEISSKLYQHETMSEASSEDNAYFRSPFTRQCPKGKSYGEISMPDSDISFVSSGRASVDRLFPLFYDCVDSEKNTTPRMSNSTNADTEFNHSFESMNAGRRSIDINSDYSAFSQDSGRTSTDSHAMENVEDEMRRLKLELKQTMEMYSSACKEALTAKQKAQELQRWKMEEQTRLEEARLAEAAALAIADKERAKSKAAIEAAEAAKRLSELEAQKRVTAEKKAHKETDKWIRETDVAIRSSFMYRKYSIEEIEEATDYFTTSRKIGEGGYGPVYKTHLDHTPVAIKVLRPDAAHGRQQFQQEVEVLSFIRHPNMVLLLGACPEYGCLVYEYLENGSLEDRLFCRGNTKPLSWQTRFKIAAEIGAGLLFLHQTKPEPLVHRDLKPANILLDRNYVSKISDVGLARLVPPSVIDTVTQYRMTSTAGTFCYIDPEYQQTGMLGVKSDVYSLGIMFLQIITARSAMGLTHHVEKAIENGTFAQILDPTVTDWPVEQALTFAKLSLKCGELRKKDRPDLGKVVLPELNKLRAFAEDGTYFPPEAGDSSPKCYSQVSVNLENPPPTSGSPLSRSLASKNPSINY